MKRIVAVLMLVVMSLSMVACGGSGDVNSSPEEVIKGFVKGIEKSDADLLIKVMLSPETKKEFKDGDMNSVKKGMEAFVKQMEEGLKMEERKIDYSSLKIELPDGWEKEDSVVVSATLDGENQEFKVIKVDGKWYLDQEMILEIKIHSSPEEVIKGFVKGIEKSDADLLIKVMLSPETKKDFKDEEMDSLKKGMEAFVNQMEEGLKMEERKIDYSSLKIELPDGWEKQDSAVVNATLDGESEEFKVIKVDGKWYLDQEMLLSIMILGAMGDIKLD